jgi:hypothetical protein
MFETYHLPLLLREYTERFCHDRWPLLDVLLAQKAAGRNTNKEWSARLELCQWIRETLDKERAYGTRQKVPA